MSPLPTATVDLNPLLGRAAALLTDCLADTPTRRGSEFRLNDAVRAIAAHLGGPGSRSDWLLQADARRLVVARANESVDRALLHSFGPDPAELAWMSVLFSLEGEHTTPRAQSPQRFAAVVRTYDRPPAKPFLSRSQRAVRDDRFMEARNVVLECVYRALEDLPQLADDDPVQGLALVGMGPVTVLGELVQRGARSYAAALGNEMLVESVDAAYAEALDSNVDTAGLERDAAAIFGRSSQRTFTQAKGAEL